MSLKIAVARESESLEKRVALAPEIAKKFKAFGANIFIEQSAGSESHFIDSDYADVNFVDGIRTAYADADLILRVTPPSLDEIEAMPDHAVLIGLMRPYESGEQLRHSTAKKSPSSHSNCYPGYHVLRVWMPSHRKVHVRAISVA